MKTLFGGLFKVVPLWCFGLLILPALWLGGEMYGRYTVQARWDAFNVAQVLANKEAIDKRNEDNVRAAAIQAAKSENIQKVKDDEINTLRASLAQSGRLRVGTAFCSGPAGQANSEGTSSGDGADPASRLLSPEVDAAVKQLILETEQAAATGRAAQAFIKENGMEQ